MEKIKIPYVGIWVKKGKSTSFCASILEYKKVFLNSIIDRSVGKFEKIKVDNQNILSLNLTIDIRDSIYQKLSNGADVFLIIIYDDNISKEELVLDGEVFDVISRSSIKNLLGDALVVGSEVATGELKPFSGGR